MTGRGLTTSARRRLPALAIGVLALAAWGSATALAEETAPTPESAPAAEAAPVVEAPAVEATPAPEPTPLSPAQEEAVRALVRETILENPELLIEALQLYDRRQKEMAAERQRENLLARQDELLNDPLAPVLGNPAGDVVIVEFFDYRCPYCKKVAEDLRAAVRDDGNIRFVLKEFPILGPGSIQAARAALAAHKQQRYEDFHFELMATPGDVDEAAIRAVAEKLGLDIEQLDADMQSEEIDAALRSNYELAEALDIGGTPAFVIGTQIYPGALSMDDLREAVAVARAESG